MIEVQIYNKNNLQNNLCFFIIWNSIACGFGVLCASAKERGLYIPVDQYFALSLQFGTMCDDLSQ
jgi:hypothetical protein